MKTIALPPLPRRQNLTDTEGVHVVKERANGELFVHYLLLVAADGTTRLMTLDPVPGRREWAWADIYSARPEALWMGVEVGSSSEYHTVPFAEIERGAKPWP